jgi:hypothetical protein
LLREAPGRRADRGACGNGDHAQQDADRAAVECVDRRLVCTENVIRVDDVMESPKLAE